MKQEQRDSIEKDIRAIHGASEYFLEKGVQESAGAGLGLPELDLAARFAVLKEYTKLSRLFS